MKRRGVSGRESFLLTKGLTDTVRLTDLIQSRFAPPLNSKTLYEKMMLIRKLALLTRKMHNSGFSHRDFYLCHILARKHATQWWELYICDLHRVERRDNVSMRWRVKDLAALNYSAPENLISLKDRILFLKEYLNKRKLDWKDRLFLAKIIKKTAKMKKHGMRKSSARTEIVHGTM
jgi:hypothetical protein